MSPYTFFLLTACFDTTRSTSPDEEDHATREEAGSRLYVDDGDEAADGDGTRERPFPTMAAAVDAFTGSEVIERTEITGAATLRGLSVSEQGIQGSIEGRVRLSDLWLSGPPGEGAQAT